MRKMNNKGFAIMSLLVVGALILGAIYLFPKLGGGEELAAVGGGEAETSPNEAGGICAVEDSTVSFYGIDRYNSLIEVGGNHYYRVLNGDSAWQTVAYKGSVTLAPGQEIEIGWGYGNITSEGLGLSVYSEIEKRTVPCEGAVSWTYRLARNNTLTTRIFNEESNIITGTENETIGTADVVVLDFDFAQTNEFEFPHGGVVTLEYNTSNYDTCEPTFDSIGKVKAEGGVPSWKTSSATANTVKAFKAPPIISSSPRVGGTVLLDAKSGVNPSNGGDTPGTADWESDVEICYIPAQAYLNSDNNEIEIGVEDQNGNQIGASICIVIEVD